MDVSDSSLEVVARLGKAMTDPTRASILLLLMQGARYPADLARELSLSRQSVSNHLSCLRGCGIVLSEQTGRQVSYRVADPHLSAALGELVRVTLAVSKNEPCCEQGCDVAGCCGAIE